MEQDNDDREDRDELWTSLAPLLPEIVQIARGEFAGTERELQLVVLLARVVAAEVEFRCRESTDIT